MVGGWSGFRLILHFHDGLDHVGRTGAVGTAGAEGNFGDDASALVSPPNYVCGRFMKGRVLAAKGCEVGMITVTSGIRGDPLS